MLPQHLIERALSLTGKTMEDMNEVLAFQDKKKYAGVRFEDRFSIEKFSYYLLSPEFIEQFHDRQYNEKFWIMDDYSQSNRKFGEAIYEYQKGNEEPIISLLSKIGDQ